MIGIVAGSFDPITFGHLWLIAKACEVVGQDGKLYIVMGVNVAKKYYFSEEQRTRQIKEVLFNVLPARLHVRTEVITIRDELLIKAANRLQATHIFRGIRNSKDFDYECEIQNVNRDIDPDIETVYFVPPAEFVKVSSSTVKGLVGFNGWETIVSNYVDPSVIVDFKKKLASD